MIDLRLGCGIAPGLPIRSAAGGSSRDHAARHLVGAPDQYDREGDVEALAVFNALARID